MTDADREREAKVLRLLDERFDAWQKKGYIPSQRIEPGDKTDEPVRTRVDALASSVFNPRQLLTLGLLNAEANKENEIS